MKKGFFKFSSKRILSSAMVVSALLVGNAAMMYADVHEVEILLQSGTVKGKVVDVNGDPIIGATAVVKVLLPKALLLMWMVTLNCRVFPKEY
ncbi:hypothetical protein [uncultured Bacteroides sp.]|uniref:hypothetical protein n=1 Tax=uncultured Bacteroides sp. TaxID=162156 RepID=UPI0025F31A20|nr:hypothetical protein [uncultured Bacteroides sp.]